MMGKKELTTMLRAASDLEEGVMGYLTKYLEEYHDWSGFPSEKVAAVKKMIARMRKDSERHNRIAENLMSWVSWREENEF